MREIIVEKESADITWVYFTGIGTGIVLLIIMVLAIRKVYKMKRLAKDLQEQNKT